MENNINDEEMLKTSEITDEAVDQAKKNASSARGFFMFKKAVLYICLTILAIGCIIPFLITIVNSTRTGPEIMKSFTLIPGSALKENWTVLFSKVNLFKGMLNSVLIALPSTLLAAYFSAITGYALAVYKFKLNKPIFTITVVFMMIPGQLSLIGFYELVKQLGIMDSYWPFILPAIAAPGAVFFLRQYVLSILPRTLLEAARIDGGNEIYIFHRIVLPIMTPGIATMAIGGFIGSWNNYLMPLILLTSPGKFTLPLMMANLDSATDVARNQGAIYLAISVAIVPVLVVFCFCSKYIIGSITAGGVKE